MRKTLDATSEGATMLGSVLEEIKGDGNAPFFRGHSDANWSLLPGLARVRLSDPWDAGEGNLYFDFVTRAGSLLPEDPSGWSHLFAMQHHGLPTRLLDWTDTPGVALYFALREGKGDACVWVLDPYELNERSSGQQLVAHPHELDVSFAAFMNGTPFDFDAVAITPLRHSPRVFSQHGMFTLHNNMREPLEKIHPDVVRAVVIPANDRPRLLHQLRCAGVSEFSLFPDLDGLGRELRGEYVVGRRRAQRRT